MYTGAVSDVGRLRWPLGLASARVFEFMWQVRPQLACRVGMDMVVDGLLGNMYAFLCQYAGDLCRRPVLLQNHLVYAPPEFRWLAVVALKAMTTAVTSALCIQPYILSRGVTVPADFPAYSRGMYADFFCDATYSPMPLGSKVNFVPLLRG